MDSSAEKGFLQFENLHGSAARPFLHAIARLRILIFHDYPYLYEGSLAYEEKYLQTYFEAPESLVILVRDGEEIVGASTAVPLSNEDLALQEPFRKKGIDPDRVLYFGESVLLKKYRGQGVGAMFFERRLAHAKTLPEIDTAAFCAVLRKVNHPLKPLDYTPLDDFWKSQGFALQDDMIGRLKWLDRGDTQETYKPMQFWLRGIGDQL